MDDVKIDLRAQRYHDGQTLEDLINAQIQYYKSNYTDFHLINSTLYNSNGIHAYEILFTTNSSSTNSSYQKRLQRIFLDNDVAYNFRYFTNNPIEFSHYLPIAREIMGSFDWQIASSPNDNKSISNNNTPGLKVLNSPQGISSREEMLYVANDGSNVVSVINTETYEMKNISVGSQPHDLVVMPADNKVYVANSGSNNVFVIDGITHGILSEIEVGSTPANIAADTDEQDRLVFVSNRDSGSISVISGETTKKIPISFLTSDWNKSGDIRVGEFPLGLDVNPVTNRLYVANSHSNTVSVIDYGLEAGTLRIYNISDISVNPEPTDVAVDYYSNKIYVAERRSDKVSVIDGSTNSIIDNINLSRPLFIYIDQDKNKLFASSDVNNTVYAVDLNSNSANATEQIPFVNGRLRYVYLDKNNGVIYVSNDRSNLVHLINGSDNNILIGVRFQINPPGGGNIHCKALEPSTGSNARYINNDYALFSINTTLQCNSQAMKGFDPTSEPSSGDFSPISANAKNKTVKFNLTHFGTITANFDEIPQYYEILNEYKDFIYGIIGAAILAPAVGWILPLAVERKEKKRQLRHLKVYVPLIDNIYKENNQNNRRCLDLLEQKRKEIVELLQEGLINDATFRTLNARILGYIYKLTE